MNAEFWSGKKVFVTGHTGFKGGWLSLWLHALNAQVHGYSLDPPTEPNFFTAARVEDHLASSHIADIRQAAELSSVMRQVAPDIVLHLAAQPLVRDSYERPAETYEVNVMGTVSLFEAIRRCASVRAAVNVTSDKCYENREWVWGYREHEAMGGYDPYSSSKGCAELVTAAYRNSFMKEKKIALASARAGNVIGGGDWADGRLVPDILRHLDNDAPVTIRSPHAVRPWQHVLEPLSGYLMLSEALHTQGLAYAEPWNFGPGGDSARAVSWILEWFGSHKQGFRWEAEPSIQPHEAGYLKIDSSKARARLEWRPAWSIDTALAKTLEWHDAWRGGRDMTAVTLSQIDAYQTTCRGQRG